MKRLILLCCVAMCTYASLFAQPVNDNCADAIPIMVDSIVDFTTIDATTDGAKHPGCFGTNDSIPADVWFTWTATTSGAYNWSNCATADFDSRIAIYENAVSCPPSDSTLIGCNDDGPEECTNSTSTLSFFANAGSTYTFRMGGFTGATDTVSSSGSGTVILTVLPDGPLNDFCANAQVLNLGTDQNFSTDNGLVDGPDHPGNDACFGFSYPTIFADIWYSFTPDFTGSVQWNTCGTINFDSRMAVYNPGSACPPTDGDLFKCNDDSGCPDFHSTLIFDVQEGETYLMRLGGYRDEDGFGTFDFEEIVPPEPPVNDLCTEASAAFVITPKQADAFIDGVFQGTTVNGSSDQHFTFPTCATYDPGGEFTDVWFSFNNEGNTSLEFRFFPLTPTSSFNVDLYSECGIPLDSTFVGRCFQTVANTDIRDTVFGLAVVPTEYLVRMVTRLTTETPGEFAFQIVDNDFASSTKDLSAAKDLRIYPNPTTNIAQFDFSLDEPKELTYTIVNSIGADIYRSEISRFEAGQNSQSINLTGYPKGLYFVTLSDGINTKTERVIKL